MPLYEYHCTACGKNTEVIQKFSDERLKACPHCQSTDFNRLTSKPSFHLKGGGWYKDSYSGKTTEVGAGTGKETKAEGPASEGKDAKVESKMSEPNMSTAKTGGCACGGGGCLHN